MGSFWSDFLIVFKTWVHLSKLTLKLNTAALFAIICYSLLPSAELRFVFWKINVFYLASWSLVFAAYLNAIITASKRHQKVTQNAKFFLYFIPVSRGHYISSGIIIALLNITFYMILMLLLFNSPLSASQISELSKSFQDPIELIVAAGAIFALGFCLAVLCLVISQLQLYSQKIAGTLAKPKFFGFKVPLEEIFQLLYYGFQGIFIIVTFSSSSLHTSGIGAEQSEYVVLIWMLTFFSFINVYLLWNTLSDTKLIYEGVSLKTIWKRRFVTLGAFSFLSIAPFLNNTFEKIDLAIEHRSSRSPIEFQSYICDLNKDSNFSAAKEGDSIFRTLRKNISLCAKYRKISPEETALYMSRTLNSYLQSEKLSYKMLDELLNENLIKEDFTMYTKLEGIRALKFSETPIQPFYKKYIHLKCNSQMSRAVSKRLFIENKNLEVESYAKEKGCNSLALELIKLRDIASLNK